MSEAELASTLSDDAATLAWQSSKAQSNPELVQFIDRAMERVTRTRYRHLDLRGKSMLCVGARAGGEVRWSRSASGKRDGESADSARDTTSKTGSRAASRDDGGMFSADSHSMRPASGMSVSFDCNEGQVIKRTAASVRTQRG